MHDKPTHRERVLAALEHRETDRVPVDLGGTESSGIHVDAYIGLCEKLAVNTEPKIFDVSQQVALVDDEVREYLDLDTVPLPILPAQWKSDTTPRGKPALVPAGWVTRTNEDGSRVALDPQGNIIAAMPAGGFYFDETFHPLSEVDSPGELDSYGGAIASFDVPFFMDELWQATGERARMLHEQTSYCVVANLCVHLLAAGQSLRGYENFMMDLIINPKLATGILERLVEAYFQRVDVFAEKVAPWVDVVLVNDDLGTQGGPMLSLDLYRRMIKPYQAQLFGYIKKRTGKPILLHSCGSVYEMIPDLIEIGVDAINPVQVSAANMDSARLKKEFGSEITFWGGGCDTQSVLSRGTPAAVRDEVKRRIDDFAPGGGFVFTQVHNIQPDVPPENVLAMFEAVREFGAY